MWPLRTSKVITYSSRCHIRLVPANVCPYIGRFRTWLGRLIITQPRDLERQKKSDICLAAFAFEQIPRFPRMSRLTCGNRHRIDSYSSLLYAGWLATRHSQISMWPFSMVRPILHTSLTCHTIDELDASSSTGTDTVWNAKGLFIYQLILGNHPCCFKVPFLSRSGRLGSIYFITSDLGLELNFSYLSYHGGLTYHYYTVISLAYLPRIIRRVKMSALTSYVVGSKTATCVELYRL